MKVIRPLAAQYSRVGRLKPRKGKKFVRSLSSFGFPLTPEVIEGIPGMEAALTELCDMVLRHAIKSHREHRKMFKDGKYMQHFPKGCVVGVTIPGIEFEVIKEIPKAEKDAFFSDLGKDGDPEEVLRPVKAENARKRQKQGVRKKRRPRKG
jgi:hypothetical protein